jgi:hypothetical protein
MENRTVTYRGHVWTFTRTGGGCTGYERVSADGTYWLLTDEDANAPDVGGVAIVGQYANEEEASCGDCLWHDVVLEWFPDGMSEADKALHAAARTLREAADMLPWGDPAESVLRDRATALWLLTAEGRAEAAADS